MNENISINWSYVDRSHINLFDVKIAMTFAETKSIVMKLFEKMIFAETTSFNSMFFDQFFFSHETWLIVFEFNDFDVFEINDLIN